MRISVSSHNVTILTLTLFWFQRDYNVTGSDIKYLICLLALYWSV